MPIPTRTTRNPQLEAEPVHTQRVTLHQRSVSQAVPTTLSAGIRSHQRTASTVIKPTIDSDGHPNPPSLQRKASVKASTSSTSRQPIKPTYQASASAARQASSLRRPEMTASSRLQEPSAKPQFSTYQHHFSPKKLARPPSVNNDGASAEAGANQDFVRSPETIRLQDELLHLQIIYSVSNKSLEKYRESSKKSLKTRAEALIEQHDALIDLEGRRNRCISHTALEDWLKQKYKEIPNFDNLQILAICVRDLENLTDSNGRLFQTIQTFEKWFEEMILALDARRNLPSQELQNLLFVEPIGSYWEDEIASLERLLKSHAGTLQYLGSASVGGISYILSTYKLLVEKSLQEIKMCDSIHSFILKQENEWLQSSVLKLVSPEEIASIPEANSRAQNCPTQDRQGIWTTIT